MTHSPRRAAAVLAVTGAALFMIVLDNLIVVSTLPAIQRSLDAPLSSLQWIVDAYILSFGVLILSGAALGERFGRRRMFVVALLLFSAASAAGALAPSVGALTAARAVQGAGAAMLMPLTLTLLTAAYPAEGRGHALGIWSAIASIAVAAGPLAGGLLATALSWHWIFWINVPIGIAAAVARGRRVLAESRGEPAPIDLTGIALASVGLLGIVWPTVRGNEAGWGSPGTLAAYATGVVALLAFVAWESRTRAPMLPLRLFRSRSFSAINATGFAFNFTMFAAFLMVVQRLSADGYGPVMIGVWTLPWTIMPMLFSPLGGRLGQRVDAAVPLIAGLGLITISVLALAAVIGPPLAMAPALAGIGVGIGFVVPNLSAVTMDAVGPADIGRASATLNTARQLGAVFGGAVAVAVLAARGFGAAVLVAGAVSGVATLLAALTRVEVAPAAVSQPA